MTTAIVTIIIFLVLISLHEFGHFIMAKLCGVNVLEFAIGMGPAILKKQGKNTLYTVRVLPIGGYCKLEGEEEKTESKTAFCNQKLYKRFLIVSAGAILNIVLGFVLMMIITAVKPHNNEVGNFINIPVIDEISQNTNLENSGVLPGDKIIGINGHRVYFYEDIPLYTSKLKEGEMIPIKVKRDKEVLTFDILPTLVETIYNYRENDVEITTLVNGVSDTVIHQYSDADKITVSEYIGKTLTQKALKIGFTPKREEVGVSNIFSYSFHYTGYVVRMVYKALWDMITGQTGFSEMSGPVGIVTAVNTAVNTGSYSLVNVLFLGALLTINLGVFNLLPLPALDGGRLFFMIIEFVRKKPIPPEKEGMVHAIGLLLLLILSVVVSYNDILKLIAK